MAIALSSRCSAMNVPEVAFQRWKKSIPSYYLSLKMLRKNCGLINMNIVAFLIGV